MAQTTGTNFESAHVKAWAKAWRDVNDDYEKLFALYDEITGVKSPQPAQSVTEETLGEQALTALTEAFPPPLTPVVRKSRPFGRITKTPKVATLKASKRRHEKA